MRVASFYVNEKRVYKKSDIGGRAKCLAFGAKNNAALEPRGGMIKTFHRN